MNLETCSHYLYSPILLEFFISPPLSCDKPSGRDPGSLSTSPVALHSHFQPVALQIGAIFMETTWHCSEQLKELGYGKAMSDQPRAGVWSAAQELSDSCWGCSDALTWPMPNCWLGPGRTFPGWQLCHLGHGELAKWWHGERLICCATADPLWFR